MTTQRKRFRNLIGSVLSSGLLLSACATPSQQPVDAEALPAPAAASPLAPPSLAFPGLFQAVALSGLYEPKDWADARPLAEPEAILAEWEAIGAPRDRTRLRGFVEANFELPGEVAADPLDLPEDRTLEEHIDLLWPVLTREATGLVAEDGSLLPLPEPYIVPGGRFREVYYWDAYFTMLGLSGEAEALRADMVENFASEIDAYGFVPNGNRTYYLSRSQPPFLFAMIALLDEDDPASAWAAHLDTLMAEYDFWMEGAEGLAPGNASARAVRLADGAVLNRYWDARDVPRDESYPYDVRTAARTARPSADVYRDLRAAAESGWDFSSRWFGEGSDLASTRTTRILPIDLNALLFGLEEAIAGGCERAGRPGCAARFEAAAAARREAMSAHLWDGASGHFADYDLDAGGPTGRPSAAMLYPLFFGAATQEQADSTADAAMRLLLAPGGMLATPRCTEEQWDAPNGWAPLQWIAAEGLSRYGEDALAEEVAARWVRTVALAFCETGKLVEKYDVMRPRPGGGGEYPTQDGFGWTNGVTAALIEERPALAPLGQVRVLGDAAACAGAVSEAVR
ncbi:alpha,alpha-trehalase TreF [Parvularcula oceani]|uniref:alpha,alpha-trehalase TreF n=1 Tax=Parvularcula oceani TaxID=1247963 RepID=UPI0009DCC438|nr:alpha,alpha-trehalase TreF [Parvularcula oceani]